MKEIKAFIHSHRTAAVIQALKDSVVCDTQAGAACFHIAVSPVSWMARAMPFLLRAERKPHMSPKRVALRLIPSRKPNNPPVPVGASSPDAGMEIGGGAAAAIDARNRKAVAMAILVRSGER